jgi:hypothetical protein
MSLPGVLQKKQGMIPNTIIATSNPITDPGGMAGGIVIEEKSGRPLLKKKAKSIMPVHVIFYNDRISTRKRCRRLFSMVHLFIRQFAG